jgi:hypothetical protein
MEPINDPRNDKKEDQNLGKFELKTKTGSVWGNNSDVDKLKEQIYDKESDQLKNRSKTILNFILSLTFIIILILVTLYLNDQNIWFF